MQKYDTLCLLLFFSPSVVSPSPYHSGLSNNDKFRIIVTSCSVTRSTRIFESTLNLSALYIIYVDTKRNNHFFTLHYCNFYGILQRRNFKGQVVNSHFKFHNKIFVPKWNVTLLHFLD